MSCCKTLGLALLLPPLTAANAAEAPLLAAEFGINRHALVTRHNVTITDFDTTLPRTRQRRSKSAMGTSLSASM